MDHNLIRGLLLSPAVVVFACSSGGSSTANEGTGSNSGGAASAGSSAAGSVSGGASASTASGGRAATTGGMTATGGGLSSGGATSAGGRVTSGGAVSAGGAAVGRGGSSATGGLASGGALSAGGGVASGGGSSNGAGAGSTAECGNCLAYTAPSQTGSVGPSALNALSGLALSRTQSDVVFAHNDGSRAMVYALDYQGREHAQITLTGATATDIEDIAVGPCGPSQCVYLADIGDNNAQRSEYSVLRFAEPTISKTPSQTALTASFERFRFVYEDGSHNAEGLMVTPGGAVYLVTKLAPGSGGRVMATGPSSIYRLPATLSTDAVMTAIKVATLTVPKTSGLAAAGAAAHPCAQSFLLRTYDRVYEFAAPAGMPFEAAFSAAPKEVAMPNEPQSEGIDYLPGGRGFITSGEGASAPIFFTGCAE